MPLSNKEYLQINQALHCLVQAYESRMLKSIEPNPLKLTLSDRAVLMVLGQMEKLNSHQLSYTMRINPGTISVYIQRLREKKLIQKKQDQNDRRNWLLSLTTLGQKYYQETIKGTVIYTQNFFSDLSENEQKLLHTLLLKPSRSLGFDWILE